MNVPAETLQKLSPCDVQALKKCLDENKGDHKKCLEEVQAFQQACSKAKPAAQASAETFASK